MSQSNGTTTLLRRLLWITALCQGTAMVEAASFPCEKANSRIEKDICADPELSALDEHLGRYYAAARTDLEEGADCLKADQRHWLEAVRDGCADRACLKSVYLDRLSELDPLQPGGVAVKHLTLPLRPALVWVIPPAADALANPRAKPLETRGILVNEVSEGEGFVLRTPEGESYLLVPLMFFAGKTVERLPELAKAVGTSYLVRGHADKDDRGRRFFEPGRCIYIYQLPDTWRARR